jgi:hypothetical protein
VRWRHWLSLPALAAILWGGGLLVGQERNREAATFGALEAPTAEAAQARALAWLKDVGKTDADSIAKAQAIWKQTDRTVLDRVADTLALGDATAARLLAEARDPLAPAPTKVPDVLKDEKRPAFYRANLALAYARSLSNRRVHEEALDTLKVIKAEQVVDPIAYLFHRSVCEHALLLQKEATRTISRLLDDAIDAPERYKTLAALMLLDMQTWKDKDLGAVARKMDNSERRLQLARGGPQTQEIQKDILRRLDELIKEKENQAKKKGGS